MPRTRIITSRIPPRQSGECLDSYCTRRFTYLTREQWRKEILEGKVALDGVMVLNLATTLQGGEMLAWDGSGIVEPAVDGSLTILQIRAHLLSAGYPIVGDKLYGRDETAFLTFIEQGLTRELEKRLVLPRCALHAAKLVFLHPLSRKEMIMRAPLPKMFSEFIIASRAN